MAEQVIVIGGGLAGSEAAYRLAREGIPVRLYEMRPEVSTPAHQGSDLAELVCSNSLKSESDDTAQGLLKMEMKLLGSLLLDCAAKTRVPAGSALAVDRQRFSRMATERLEKEAEIEIVREEVCSVPADRICILASGPLTSPNLAADLAAITGRDQLSFYDAIAPSVLASSLDTGRIFKASRYGRGSADYYNCPMTKDEYEAFYSALVEADAVAAREFEKGNFFNACMPVEELASKGIDTLRFGTMRPVGLTDPGTNAMPYAVVQLRQEDLEGRIYGLVGFQTRLRRPEQERVFRMIPGLEQARFVRYGAMHRNTFINSPIVLCQTLQLKERPSCLIAGQLSGVEGYMESAATGILAGINAARIYRGQPPIELPDCCMLGALVKYICSAPSSIFQPMNANFGLMPPLDHKVKKKSMRYKELAQRSLSVLREMSELLQK